MDYTKGLPERFRALQHFFDRHPEYRERMTFVQIAAPSRTRIKRYQELSAEIDETVEEINRALGTRRWRPIVLRQAPPRPPRHLALLSRTRTSAWSPRSTTA